MRVRGQRMPRVLQEVDQGSSPTGWHFSGDLNEAQERALHLWGCSGQKNSKHSPKTGACASWTRNSMEATQPGRRWGQEEYGGK